MDRTTICTNIKSLLRVVLKLSELLDDERVKILCVPENLKIHNIALILVVVNPRQVPSRYTTISWRHDRGFTGRESSPNARYNSRL